MPPSSISLSLTFAFFYLSFVVLIFFRMISYNILSSPGGLSAITLALLISGICIPLSGIVFGCSILLLVVYFLYFVFIRKCRSFSQPEPYGAPKCVLITGAGSTSGLGFHFASEYIIRSLHAKQSLVLILLDLHSSALATVSQALFVEYEQQRQVIEKAQIASPTTHLPSTEGGSSRTISSDIRLQVITQAADVTDAAQMQSLLISLNQQYNIDLVIANAGIAPTAFQHLSIEEQTRKVHDVNTTGVMNTVFPLMNTFRSRKHGQFIVVSSVAGWSPIIVMIYTATKAWVQNFGRLLRRHCAADNVSVVTFCPGFVSTNITSNRKDLLFVRSAREMCHNLVNGAALNISTVLYPNNWWPIISIIHLLGPGIVDALDMLIPQAEAKASDSNWGKPLETLLNDQDASKKSVDNDTSNEKQHSPNHQKNKIA